MSVIGKHITPLVRIFGWMLLLSPLSCAEAEPRPEGEGFKAATFLPPVATKDFGKFITSYPNGGLVKVPDGTFTVSDVVGFRPTNPLVLVAQNPGRVKVVRAANVLGETDLLLEDSSNIVFVGIAFTNIMVAIYESNDVSFYHTTHTYPPGASPEPTRKVCGGQRDPSTFIIRQSDSINLYGVTINDVGHDGIKLGGSTNINVVGTSITNVRNGGLQTETTVADSASCGHEPGDLFHHSDDTQIHPGSVDGLLLDRSYTDGGHMWQVSGSGGSIHDVVVQGSVLAIHKGAIINTRVKPGSTGVVEIALRDTKTFNAVSAKVLYQVYTEGTVPGTVHVTRVNTKHIQGTPSGPTPADIWRTQHPIGEWQCFVVDTLGYTVGGATCP